MTENKLFNPLKSVIEMINKGPFFMHMAMRVTELDIL